MTVKLLLIGKTTDRFIEEITKKYSTRLQHYCKFEIEVIPELKIRKNMSEENQKNLEGEQILKRINTADELILLDEKGKEFTSLGFSQWMQKQLNSGKKQLVFVVGGPYGFSDEVYKKAHQKIAFSKMTFPHELIRPFVAEQLYRAFSILKNEPYHHP